MVLLRQFPPERSLGAERVAEDHVQSALVPEHVTQIGTVDVPLGCRVIRRSLAGNLAELSVPTMRNGTGVCGTPFSFVFAVLNP
ncbi:hypothetical protein ACFQEX_23875 [Roseibium salinum]|uniref:hypothetical protein n=1 Tax=Roseibium salinum TaxID=1604349 RepID=UPI0036216633